MKRREREFMKNKKLYNKRSKFFKLIMSKNYGSWFKKLSKRKRKKMIKKWIRKTTYRKKK